MEANWLSPRHLKVSLRKSLLLSGLEGLLMLINGTAVGPSSLMLV